MTSTTTAPWPASLAHLRARRARDLRGADDLRAKRAIRVLVILSALVAIAAALGTPSIGATTPSCTTSSLVLWAGDAEGAAGSMYRTLELTNQSGHACVLFGYPGVSAVDLHGHALGAPASRFPGTRVRVTLRNGATARATLRIAQAANFPAARCDRTAAAGLRVYPPGQTASKTVPFPFDACARRGPVYLSVGPVRR
jgi:hypothetical protein